MFRIYSNLYGFRHNQDAKLNSILKAKTKYLNMDSLQVFDRIFFDLNWINSSDWQISDLNQIFVSLTVSKETFSSVQLFYFAWFKIQWSFRINSCIFTSSQNFFVAVSWTARYTQQYRDDKIIELFIYAQNGSSTTYTEHLNNKIIDYTLY